MKTSTINTLQQLITANLLSVRQEVSTAAKSCGRTLEEITIVGVTKLHPPEMIAACVYAGITQLGENRIQEAAVKIPRVNQFLKTQGYDPAAVKWHLIGTLQSNKAVKAARLFDVIQSLETLKTALKLSKVAVEEAKQLDVYVEVNSSREEWKGGITPEETLPFCLEISELPGLCLKGLMTLGPLTTDETKINRAFELMRNLRDEVAQSLPKSLFGGGLSMGMSGDFHLAIANGATMVRIGTSLFGQRSVKK